METSVCLGMRGCTCTHLGTAFALRSVLSYQASFHVQ